MKNIFENKTRDCRKSIDEEKLDKLALKYTTKIPLLDWYYNKGFKDGLKAVKKGK